MDYKIEQMQAVIEALPDPVFIITESGRYADIVGGSDSRFYHDGSVLVGKLLSEVLPKEKADWFLAQIAQALKINGLHTVEYALGGEEVDGLDNTRGPAGSLWFEGRIQPLASTYDGERAVVWVARNITQRYELENRLRILSEQDELTGIYNRRKFIKELQHRFDELQRYHTATAVLMLDIDHFKAINDRLGHHTGDDVLIKVANRCKSLLRKTDVFARFGGEEFIFLLPQTQINDAVNFAKRISSEISTISIEENSPVTVSIGVAEILESDKQPEEVIRRADKALYQAKHAGRNRIATE
ncbi:MAG: diguanylate cyclase [Gammaproteobacteria bacterium]|jgi:diguanylate cyclase (GGDEF)-like protein